MNQSTNRPACQPTSLTVYGLVLLSFALTLHGLAADSFWGDEILTAMFAGQAPAEVIRWTAADIHPPLYYLLAGSFTRLLLPLGELSPSSVSDWLWRFPSVVAAVLTVALVFPLTRYLLRPLGPRLTQKTTLAAMLLTALAPIILKYSQEARMHALFMMLSALSTVLFFRAMTAPRRGSRWLVFALATAANIYTMYFGFLILAAQAGYLLFMMLQLGLSRSMPRLSGFSVATVAALVLYGPWWPVLFGILRRRAAVGAIEGGVGRPLDFMRGVVQALGPQPEPVAWLFLLLFLLGLLLLIRRPAARPAAGFAVLWLALPVALPIFLGDPRALQFRYAFVLPVYLIVIALAVITMSRILARRADVYAIWVLATLSFIAALQGYQQTKPDWRAAAAYLDARATPDDIILLGPLWDEGRFIDYYYRGQAQLLTPAAMVTNIERRVESLRTTGGRVWAVNRFAPADLPALQNHAFSGVVVSEPALAVYEPALLTEAAVNLAEQAVEAAYPWAAAAQAQGVLDPDPRTARAAALRALGDTLVAARRLPKAVTAYQTAVDIFPGWVGGFLALAQTQEKLGNLPAAAEAYRQAVAFNLDWHGPAADQAAALVEAGQWQAALAQYHQITGQ